MKDDLLELINKIDFSVIKICNYLKTNENNITDEEKYSLLDTIDMLIENKKTIIIKDFKEEPTFYKFCIRLSKFHKENKDKPYIKETCETLQALCENRLLNSKGKPYHKLVISMPPGHGKTFTLQLFTVWVLAFKGRENKFLNACFSLKNATESSMAVKSLLECNKDVELPNFKLNELIDFPFKFRKDSRQKTQWALEEQSKTTYLAISPKNGFQGSRCNYLLIDDVVKDGMEGMDKRVMENLDQSFYQNSALSRLEKTSELDHSKVIILQTQWSKWDLIGIYTKKEYEDEYYKILYPALLNEEEVLEHGAEPKMLNDNILDYNSFYTKQQQAYKNVISKQIFNCLYLQKVSETGTFLYNFKDRNFYKEIPKNNSRIVATLDPNNGGKDKASLWIGKVVREQEEFYTYIIDAFAKNGKIEDNLIEIANLIKTHKVKELTLENNNGGDALKTLLTRQLKDIGYKDCIIKLYHQTKNKDVRINIQSINIQNKVKFPMDFKEKHDDIWEDLINFPIERKKDTHDDIEDSLTLFMEKYGNKTLLQANQISRFSKNLGL